jgi:hypothetical protein
MPMLIPLLLIIFALAVLVGGVLLKAWEAGKFPFSSRAPVRNIPYYQPSQPSYQQGYQQQPAPSKAHSPAHATPKEESPSLYGEMPQAQYPEQAPPMM